MYPLAANDPRVIGRYQLLASLGQGGMGHVYLAIGPTGQRLAVKRILPHLSNDPGFYQRFAMEVEAAGKVSGPHTAAVIDADTASAEPWSATEFIAGPTLTAAIEWQGALPESFVRTLGANLSAALTGIHDAGLIHRDIKPSNVLLSSSGPKLLDFGISRAMDYSTSVALTHTGGVVGSPGYMSPEQAESRALTEKSDVFSLGCLLAIAATGRAVFEGPSVPQVMYKVVHDEPNLDEVPESLREPIRRCLEKDPEQRPSPEQLCTLLEAGGETTTQTLPLVVDFVAGQEVHIASLRRASAAPPTLVDTASTMVPTGQRSRTSGRDKGLIAAVVALALALLIGIPLAVLLPVSSSEGEDSAESTGDSAGQGSQEPEDPLEMPTDVCDVFDMDGFRELVGPEAEVEEEPHVDTAEDGYQSCTAMLSADISVTSLSIMVENMAESSSSESHVVCQLEGCDDVEPSGFPYGGESDARPWGKGGLVKEPADLSMMWYQGDFSVWVVTIPALEDEGEEAQDFLLEQGIAVYDLMEK